MRHLLFLFGLFACGSTPSATSPSYGTITATLSGAFESNTVGGQTRAGHPDRLSASLFPNATAPSSPCAGATITDGACCYIPASAPPPSDGGPDFVMLDVGPIALSDVTSGATFDSLNYNMSLVDGFGWAEGYAAQDFGPGAWNVGDTLEVSVAGGPLGAFTARAVALASPVISAPTSMSLANGVTLAWTPDANAQTMTVTLYELHGTVTCTLADAAKSVTIAPDLVTGFASGDSVTGTMTRSTAQPTAVSGGAVTFVSSAVSDFQLVVN